MARWKAKDPAPILAAIGGGEATLPEIAARMGVAASSLAARVGLLVRRGYLARRARARPDGRGDRTVFYSRTGLPAPAVDPPRIDRARRPAVAALLAPDDPRPALARRVAAATDHPFFRDREERVIALLVLGDGPSDLPTLAARVGSTAAEAREAITWKGAKLLVEPHPEGGRAGEYRLSAGGRAMVEAMVKIWGESDVRS